MKKLKEVRFIFENDEYSSLFPTGENLITLSTYNGSKKMGSDSTGVLVEINNFKQVVLVMSAPEDIRNKIHKLIDPVIDDMINIWEWN